MLKRLKVVQLKGTKALLERMRKSPTQMMKDMSTRQIMVRRQNSALQKITNVNKKKSPTLMLKRMKVVQLKGPKALLERMR